VEKSDGTREESQRLCASHVFLVLSKKLVLTEFEREERNWEMR